MPQHERIEGRRLNALIRDILEASMEVLKRFFVRVFIDQQPIL